MPIKLTVLLLCILTAIFPASAQAAQIQNETVLIQNASLWLNREASLPSETGLLLAAQPAAVTKSTGFSLAWGVMIIMVAALVVSVVMVLRAFQGKPMNTPKGWLEYAIPVLSVIGLVISIYLTYIEFTSSRAVCGPVGDCNAVQNSAYAKLFGVIPIGLVGTIGYIAILAAWGWHHFRSDSISRIAGPAIFGMGLFGTLFSIYLTYLELFVIYAVCIWCVSSAVIMTALMLLSLPYVTQWLAITDEEE
jgi:uncharacterized membrane protein